MSFFRFDLLSDILGHFLLEIPPSIFVSRQNILTAHHPIGQQRLSFLGEALLKALILGLYGLVLLLKSLQSLR